MRKMLVAFASAVTALGLFLPASAQEVPSYARPSYANGDEAIRGRIAAINGTYAVTVRDRRGFLDSVALHPGTIINPIGLRLAPGMRVVVLGRPNGPAFAADEIDTPYAYAHRRVGWRGAVLVAPR